MKINVPFFEQTTNLNCGPAALKMILSYLGKDFEIKELEEKTGIKPGKGVYTIQLANAAARFGFKVDYYTKSLGFNKENLKHEFYKKYSEMDLDLSERLVLEAKEIGVNLAEKSISLKEILKGIGKDSIPLILLDWNVVEDKGDKGYQGHFVPIVGYDENHIYVHNSESKEKGEFFPIPRNIFDEARKSDGTDEDVAIIYKME
jgi:uncharacterized protein YvpB